MSYFMSRPVLALSGLRFQDTVWAIRLPNKNLGNDLGNIGMGVKYRFIFIQLANKQGGDVLTCGARMDLTVTSNDKAGRHDK